MRAQAALSHAEQVWALPGRAATERGVVQSGLPWSWGVALTQPQGVHRAQDPFLGPQPAFSLLGP